MLMTDGVADFVLNSSESGPLMEFIVPFYKAMNDGTAEHVANELGEYLAGVRANAASRDDKTVIWLQQHRSNDLV
jgi:hypothetical protein